MITGLMLDGHKLELFSFLEPRQVERLKEHPAASVPLFTFADIKDDRLHSVTTWNLEPMAVAFTSVPQVRTEKFGRGTNRWITWQGRTTSSSLIDVAALTLVRYLFFQGYSCGLDQFCPHWAPPADPGLCRLGFLHGQGKKSTNWVGFRDRFFQWAMDRLATVQVRFSRRDECRRTTN